ncbi:MAG: hypothetical protein Q7K44_02660 [Candidatus Liptonbacteria bacterium]|nr:hypothetical protein [Candidatus Liptonbacteria bacterium]
MSKKRTLAVVFMVLLIAWDTAEFAFQPARRPVGTEIAIFIVFLLVLIFIPLMAVPKRWSSIGAFWAVLPQFIFGAFGAFVSPINQGFGKIGPGVAALLTLLSAYYAFHAYREE